MKTPNGREAPASGGDDGDERRRHDDSDDSIGYNEAGDKVEYVFEPTVAEGTIEIILLRNEHDIREALSECEEKVWWNLHRQRVAAIAAGDEQADARERAFLARAERRAREIQAKYGRDDLELSDFERGKLWGKFTALSWVTGSDWDDWEPR